MDKIADALSVGDDHGIEVARYLGELDRAQLHGEQLIITPQRKHFLSDHAHQTVERTRKQLPDAYLLVGKRLRFSVFETAAELVHAVADAETFGQQGI